MRVYDDRSGVAFWKHEQSCAKLQTPGAVKQVRMSQLSLARRLRFAPDGMSVWAGEAGWRVRMLFAWQRLIRAGKVQQGRRRSPMWREGERHRVAAMVEQHRLELRNDEDWATDSTSARGQRYAWDLEASIQAQHGVNNGAAAVMARRQHQNGGSSTRAQPAAAGSSVQHAQGGRGKRGRVDDSPNYALRRNGAQQGSDQNETDGMAGGSYEPPTAARRSGDGLLVYNSLSLQRLEAQLRSPYYWQRAPFGDG